MLEPEAHAREPARAWVRAYNDWMVGWRPDSESRPIQLCIVPIRDADLGAEKMRRNEVRGRRAVCCREIPSFLDGRGRRDEINLRMTGEDLDRFTRCPPTDLGRLVQEATA